MRKIIAYIILSSGSAAQLEMNVCKEMKNDWQPLGGVSFFTMDDSCQYICCQAMVKYENN